MEQSHKTAIAAIISQICTLEMRSRTAETSQLAQLSEQMARLSELLLDVDPRNPVFFEAPPSDHAAESGCVLPDLPDPPLSAINFLNNVRGMEQAPFYVNGYFSGSYYYRNKPGSTPAFAVITNPELIASLILDATVEAPDIDLERLAEAMKAKAEMMENGNHDQPDNR